MNHQDWNPIVIHGKTLPTQKAKVPHREVTKTQTELGTHEKVSLSVAKTIQQARIAKGYKTQKDFAVAVGVPANVINSYESGKASKSYARFSGSGSSSLAILIKTNGNMTKSAIIPKVTNMTYLIFSVYNKMNNPTETLRKIRQYKAEVKAIRARDAKVGKFSEKIGNLSVKVGESLKKGKIDQAMKYQTKIKKFQKEINKLYNMKLY